MKKVLAAALVGGMLTACTQKSDNNQNEEDMNTTLTLTQEWDKTFPKSDKVDHKKITFKNRYGIELAADMYIPKAPPELFGEYMWNGNYATTCLMLRAEVLLAS